MNNLKLTGEHIKIYKELNSRQSIYSSNVGVVGNKRYLKQLYNKYKTIYGQNATIIINDRLLRIIYDDYEITYILIENINDLIGKTFKTYIYQE